MRISERKHKSLISLVVSTFIFCQYCMLHSHIVFNIVIYIYIYMRLVMGSRSLGRWDAILRETSVLLYLTIRSGQGALEEAFRRPTISPSVTESRCKAAHQAALNLLTAGLLPEKPRQGNGWQKSPELLQSVLIDIQRARQYFCSSWQMWLRSKWILFWGCVIGERQVWVKRGGSNGQKKWGRTGARGWDMTENFSSCGELLQLLLSEFTSGGSWRSAGVLRLKGKLTDFSKLLQNYNFRVIQCRPAVK